MNIIVIIYKGPESCLKCLGWKRVEDNEFQSWEHWADLPEASKAAIEANLLHPVTCAHCNSTGQEPEETAT